MTSILDTKILLVDDSNTVLNILKKTLNQIGVKEFSLAEDGRKAWTLIRENAKLKPYDLILCDWIMPEISGIELLGLIRQSSISSISNMRFIMVTGADEKVKTAMEAGADNFISKPFTHEELRNKLEFVLRPNKSY